MILVGTAVWIRALSGQPPYKTELDKLLASDDVVGHELVFGELLIGDRGGREEFLTAYRSIHQAITVPHQEVVRFVRERRLHGRGVGWIDVHLLASALVGRLKLWTVDTRFSTLAKELGVAYELL